MDALDTASCSVAPTKRKRFMWAAWWTGPPTQVPFRKPDAYEGGARTREEARSAAEQRAGRTLSEIPPAWARAWMRVLAGQKPWFEVEGRPVRKGDEAVTGTAKPVVPNAASILGVTGDATPDDIKRAYRERALETHPDRGGDPEAFRAVQRAYEQLAARAAEGPRRKRKRR